MEIIWIKDKTGTYHQGEFVKNDNKGKTWIKTDRGFHVRGLDMGEESPYAN